MKPGVAVRDRTGFITYRGRIIFTEGEFATVQWHAGYVSTLPLSRLAVSQ